MNPGLIRDMMFTLISGKPGANVDTHAALHSYRYDYQRHLLSINVFNLGSIGSFFPLINVLKPSNGSSTFYVQLTDNL